LATVSSIDDLLAQERELLAKLDVVRREISGLMRAHRIEGKVLTQRQEQVLGMVRSGKLNKEIAGTLNISERGAKFHVSCLLRIYAVKSRREL
jgi:DNA-binding NarL/FixJ family response regulator